MSEPPAAITTCIGMCACARTREYCVTKGCKREEFEWRYSTEGREKDRLRRVIDTRRSGAPVSRWVRPERAVAEAWVLNMSNHGQGRVLFITKLGPFAIETRGVA